MDGWIPLHRKIQNDPLWFSQPFTKGMAWVDLLILANFKEGTIFVRGQQVQISRGQIGWSQDSLASRWQWSRTKVKNFLNYLEARGSIVQAMSNVTTLITLVNYETYQKNENQNIMEKSSKRTAESQQKNSNKKNNKNKKKIDLAIDAGNYEKDFSKEMIDSFLEYWTEATQSGKERWHLEKTWDTGRRLKRWHSNEKSSFGKNIVKSQKSNGPNGLII